MNNNQRQSRLETKHFLTDRVDLLLFVCAHVLLSLRLHVNVKVALKSHDIHPLIPNSDSTRKFVQ